MFDYVIVGAGSAGCVLASRLTEDPGTTVLLLEAGGPDSRQEVHIPAAFPKLFKTSLDWAYETEPQAGLKQRTLYWPRGKMLGGSSSMNAMMYVRGSASDYDAWRDRGNEGWGFADVLPYFKRGERQERGASTYHGADGPLHVADQRSSNPLSRLFLEAGREIGLVPNEDFNGPNQEGIGFAQVTQKQGKRHSAADAYLRPAMQRPNLTVRTQAQATRLLVEGTRVVGVEYLWNGAAQQERVSREVLVCGGTINSPHLLLLSGIGPAEQLTPWDIPVVTDLPGVGANLQDHLLVVSAYACTQPVTLASAEKLGNIVDFLLFKKGPLTSNIGEAAGFLKTMPDLPAPDLELLFAPVYFLEHGFANPPGHGFSIGLTLLHPESRGTISLRSADPLAPPAIQPNYLASTADLDRFLVGLKLARRLAYAKAFDPFRGAEIWPGPNTQSDEALIDFIRARAETLYHPVGTCKMGHDSLAVVDSQLRVRGVEGVRVADASVMPSIISGHTNAPTLMIAEKAADLIRGRAHGPSLDRLESAFTGRAERVGHPVQ